MPGDALVSPDRHPHEHGDRAAFLAPARRGLVTVAPVAGPSPVPEALLADPAPTLLAGFVRAATAAGAEVVTTTGATVPDGILDRWLAAHDVRTAVRSAAPEAEALGAALEARGIEVAPVTVADGAEADLGVTSASHLVASTGSLVLRSDVDGRLASLLPPVHICVAPADRLVATPGSVLRALGDDGPPPGLVLATGTSRSGDIEQLLTRKVHGPGTVLVCITGARSPA